MSKIYLEIFDKPRRDVFEQLKAFENSGYLAGGTALALQIKHRISYDFDIFISHSIDNTLRQKIKSVFGDVSYSLNTPDQINFQTKGGVNISFVWYYFSLLQPVVSTGSLPLASITDIAADKAHTIGRRAVWRDYVDIYVLLKKEIISLDTIIQSAEKKFKGEFVSSLFLEQLVYFADVQVVSIEFYESPISSLEIQEFLRKTVKEYIRF